MRRLEERIEILSETMRAFAEATSDLDQLLDTVTERLANAIGESCVLFLVSEDGEVLLPVSIHARVPALLARFKTLYASAPVRLADHGVGRQILASGKAALFARVDYEVDAAQMAPAYLERFKEIGTHSAIVAPVRARGKAIGLLSLRRHSPESPSFDEVDRDLAQNLADHAGLAIANARLFQHAQSDASARTRAEARFSRLSDAGIIGILIATVGSRVLEINDTLLAMLGYSREEILSGKVVWKDLTPPEWRGVDAAAIAQLGQVGVARLREKEYIRKDGSRISVLAGTAMLPGTDGESISFVLDQTDRKVTERIRARLAAIVASSSDAIFSRSPTGTIDSWNQGAERLFGYSAQEALGQPVTILVPPPRLDELGGALGNLLQGVPIEPFETVRLARDGTLREVSVAASPLRDEHGRSTGISVIARDISANKRAERLVRATLAEREVMLKEIHHRVKNNLQVVTSILRLQARHVTDPAALAAFEASQGRVRSIALLHEKLYQSQDLGSVDVASYARSLAQGLLRMREGTGFRVSVAVEGEGVDLPVDLAAPCGLILNELLTNAFRHAFVGHTGPAQVRVGARTDGGAIELTVSDNGIGLPPGFDASGSSSLGMYLARTLAEQLGGTLTLAADHGTRCTLRFPRHREDD